MQSDLFMLPQLIIQNTVESPLPLKLTTVETHITGLVATVTLIQQFQNPLTSPSDLEYQFPLPQNAAVTSFEINIGDRIVDASVHEIEHARQQYNLAKDQGKHAGLLENRRPNLFRLQLANILPAEFIQATLKYQQRLDFSDGGFEFVFPMGITPKYNGNMTTEVSECVNPPIAVDLTQVGAVEINVQIEAGLPIEAPTSPSHPLIVTQTSNSRFSIVLNGPHLPDHDFVLRWRQVEKVLQFPAWWADGEKAGYFLATFMPPEPGPTTTTVSREYIFILDRSGSMSGAPIRQAVNALRASIRMLEQSDTFAILLFDDRIEWLLPPSQVSQAGIDLADRLLEQVSGRGGTEILPALETALTLKSDPERTRLIVFLTDGAISAERETIKRAQAQIGTTTLFTIGVGPSVNRAFLQQLARIGRGEAAFIGLDEDIEEAILQFHDRISFPLVTGLNLRAEGGQIWDTYPSRLPDLYAGRPLEVVGRFTHSTGTSQTITLVAEGQRSGSRLEMRAAFTTPPQDPASIQRLWARARVDDLLEQTDLGFLPEHTTRSEVISLAVENSLLTRYTAFLAVDNMTATVPGKSQFISVSHPLPQGLDPDGFVPSAASMMPPSPSAAIIPKLSRGIPVANLEGTPLSVLGLPDHLYDSLKQDGINTIEDAVNMLEKDEGMLMSDKFFRDMRLGDLRQKIAEENLVYPDLAPSIQPGLPRRSGVNINEILHELARKQSLDGSWKNDVEFTAAALLAFIRNGHTFSKGHYRKQLQRAFDWLAQNNATGFAAFLRCAALQEISTITQEPKHIALSQSALDSLPVPGDVLESSMLKFLRTGDGMKDRITDPANLNELRWMLAAGVRAASINQHLMKDELGRVMAAGIIVQ